MTLTRSRYDTAFEQEELWLEDCQNAFLELETNALDYIKLNVERGKPELENEIETPSTDNNGNNGDIETPPTDNNGNQNNHGETGENESETVENGTETSTTNSNNTAATASLTSHNVIISGVGSNSQASNEAHNNGHTPCGFKMEKPKIPRFNGDVRDYAIFRADFKRVVQYTQLESIRLWYLRFDRIVTNRFPWCRFVILEVDLRET